MQIGPGPQMQELPLREIHAAPAPPWWPPAPGWWLLAVVLLILLAFAGLRLWRSFRRRRFARQLRAELDSLVAAHQANRDDQLFVRDAATLLRRLRVWVAGDRAAASLNGEAWVEYLVREADNDPVLRKAAEQLASSPYRPGGDVDVAAIATLSRLWLERTVREATHA